MLCQHYYSSFTLVDAIAFSGFFFSSCIQISVTNMEYQPFQDEAN